MKQLTINWRDLETALEDPPTGFSDFVEQSNYLGRETGQVVIVDETIRDAVSAAKKRENHC